MKFSASAMAVFLLVLLPAGLGMARSHHGRDAHRRSSRQSVAAAPAALRLNAVFTATRQINALRLAPDGSLWAATGGGVLRAERGGKWRKWTRADGLPSHEVLDLCWQDGGMVARTPRGEARLAGNRWTVSKSATTTTTALQPVEAVWRGVHYGVTAAGLEARPAGQGEVRKFALPNSRGTHITALLGRETTLLAGLYGDGVWRFDGAGWSKMAGVPEAAREVTALAGGAKGVLWLGTRRDGVWKFDGARWKALPPADEPFDHNAQAMVRYGGELWISTLEDGLVARTAHSWRHFDTPQLSTSAPRQFVSFGGALYARHGGGQVDRYDGKHWTRDVFAFVPRHKTLCIAQGGGKLYLGQWGGWSEWDGHNWAHFFAVPELRGVPLMALLPAGGAVWVGTQSRGLLRCVRAPAPASDKTAAVTATVLDERQGLPDEWVTCLASQGDSLFAGTFVGGLARLAADEKTERAQIFPALAGENVTALEPDGHGGLWIATRSGLWHEKSGVVKRATVPGLDSEIQTLCASGRELWVGTRTGLFRIAAR